MTQGYSTRVVSTVREVTIDENSLDAFSRLRVSNPQSLFSVQCQYDLEPLIMEGGNTSDGVAPAFDSSKRMAQLRVAGGATGGTSYLQSYEYVPYQPGRSQLIFLTCVIGEAESGAQVLAGLGDAANGIFFEQDTSGNNAFTIRSSTSGSVVDDTVTQSSWNLDPMNGNGPSGLTLDVTKDAILVFDAQYLGMGRVRCGFDIDGRIIWCHEFLHANVIAVPYAQALSLPILIEIRADGGGLAGDKVSWFKCAAVASEGSGDDNYGYKFAREGNVTAASGSRTQVVSLRPATTFNSLTNRMNLDVDSVDLLVTGANPIYYEIVVGAAFSAGPSFSAVNATYSGAEIGTGGTFSNLTNGIVLSSGYVAATSQNKSSTRVPVAKKAPICLNRAGSQRDLGTLTVLATGLGGTSACRAAVNWQERR